uniref:Tf2-1-like SH3-like domain-containing protein n=1 Tax=Peronospora matthiolae TaxID=2874970 RepID=A0AAV1TKK5_9STRA
MVSAVCGTRLHPRFIGPFTVVAKQGIAYTLNLPRKMRTHPVFCVGLIKPYVDSLLVNHEALAPREFTMPQVEEPSREDPVVLQEAPLGHAYRAPRALTRQRRVEIHLPMPALVDDQENQQHHVERILQRRRRDG